MYVYFQLMPADYILTHLLRHMLVDAIWFMPTCQYTQNRLPTVVLDAENLCSRPIAATGSLQRLIFSILWCGGYT